MRAFLFTAAVLALISGCAFGQTTRTSPFSSATSKSIPSSSSTSPNSPCVSTKPSSPCYSAVAPDEPCSTTITPNTNPPSAPAAATIRRSTVHAITEDQAKSQIEAQGYPGISGLRKDAKGLWRGTVVRDGSTVNVTLDEKGNVTAK